MEPHISSEGDFNIVQKLTCNRIVFPDPTRLSPGAPFNPQRLPDNISYNAKFTSNLQTLSSNDADPDGVIQGLLYVPDMNSTDPCFNESNAYLPLNVTRQIDLPSMDFNVIAIAPWVSVRCTLLFLASAQFDPIRAFIFYLPNNDTAQPPPISSPVWSLEDGGQWKSTNKYPVYAVPGSIGNAMTKQLGLYSGNMSTVPYGRTMQYEYGLDPTTYVRIYTEIDITAESSLPSLWVFLLIVAGGLIFILTSTSCMMHWLQRRRRENLRRRIARGQVDLEALGIKRLTVPGSIIDKMPLYIYTCREDETEREGNSESSLPRAGRAVRDVQGRELAAAAHDESGAASMSAAAADITASSSDDGAGRSSLVAHEYLQDSQPTCPICLEDFESGITTIRELPCGHIYHPECIDSFLSNNSSLCPMCKKSTLPLGHCPASVTNGMVRRERAIRRLRSRAPSIEPDQESGWGARWNTLRIASRRVRAGNSPHVNEPEPAYNPDVELRPRSARVVNTVDSPAAQDPALSRREVAQQRVQEILDQSTVAEDPDPVERANPKWRRALSKIFPGFK